MYVLAVDFRSSGKAVISLIHGVITPDFVSFLRWYLVVEAQRAVCYGATTKLW